MLTRTIGLFRRPAAADDRLPGTLPTGGPHLAQTIWGRYVRRVGTMSDGESVFVMPGTLGPYRPPARCLARLSRTRRKHLLARVRKFTLPLIFVQAFNPDGTPASAAFLSEPPDELRIGMNIAGVELTRTAALIGVVPDGVQSVAVDYEAHVTFRATITRNLFVHEIPDRFSVGDGDPPTRETWRDARGRVLRTIVFHSGDGTIIVYRPGHNPHVYPGD